MQLREVSLKEMLDSISFNCIDVVDAINADRIGEFAFAKFSSRSRRRAAA